VALCRTGVGQRRQPILYGTTAFGGTYGGTIFQITPSGVLTTLHTFCAKGHCRGGKNPSSGLVQADNGILYGTAYYGGAPVCGLGCGTIFSLVP